MNLAAHSPQDTPASPAHAQAQVRVMVCDDSVAIRGTIVRMLETDPAIRVVARAANGHVAIDELARTQVDVLVLDVEMPVLDALAALPLLLRTDPDLRVIMSSTLTTRGADVAMRALRLGAANHVPKPTSIGLTGGETFRRELIEKVKGLARLRRRAVAANADRAGAANAERAGLASAPRAGAATPGRAMTASEAGRNPAAALRLQAAAPLPARLLAIGSSTGARRRCSPGWQASARRCRYLWC